MKYCPHCGRSYSDDDLLFCLEDGTNLFASANTHAPTQIFDDAETFVRRQTTDPNWRQSRITQPSNIPPKARKNNFAPLIILTAVLCVFFGGIAGIWFLIKLGYSSEVVSSNLSDNRTGKSNTDSKVPKPPATNAAEKNQKNRTISDLNDGGSGQFIGCFKDTNAFDLDGYVERSPSNTPQRCAAVCRAKGFRYAGVQYGESCLCGNNYGKYGAADNCNYKCSGDENQICGGYSANSVYDTETVESCGHFLSSVIYEKWMRTGGEKGTLGCPTMNETEAATSLRGTTGRMTQFRKGDGGYIILHDSGKFSGTAFEVSGCMFKLYADLGGTASRLGFPVGDGYKTPTGARQEFEEGYITWDSKNYQCYAFDN